MSTWDITVIALFAWLTLDRLIGEVGSVLKARAKAGATVPDCRCAEPLPGETAARKVH